MATEWIIALTAFCTLFLGGLGKFLTAYFSSSTEDIINVREMLSGQIQILEKRQEKTDKELEKLKKINFAWIRKYWALYRWTLISTPEMIPPAFHGMKGEEVEETVAEMYRKNNRNNET